MNEIDALDKYNKLHFIGIGGAGMFPLAQILTSKGYEITGSDIVESETFRMAQNTVKKVFLGHKAENIESAQLVVYSAAVNLDINPEILQAKKNNIPIMERSVILGLVTKRYSSTICISGTHGKTTTTSMATEIFMNAKCDPTVLIGGLLPSLGGNGRAGNSDYFICEACEFHNTFLELFPDIAVILNIDTDHLDFFKTMDNLISSFRLFANKASKAIVVNGDDRNSLNAVEGIATPIITFGLLDHNDVKAKNIRTATTLNKINITKYDLYIRGEFKGEIELYVPGIHNVMNSLAACACAYLENLGFESVSKGLTNFKGTQRRFQILGEKNGITICDDFAHHPTEVEATLKAAKTLNFNNIWLIFQPHTYSRTHLLLNEFIKVLSLADKVIVTDIYAAREINTYNISSSAITDKLKNSINIPSLSDAAKYAFENAKAGDIIISMGGGNVYKAAYEIMDYK